MIPDFCVCGIFEVSPSIVSDIYLFCCSPIVISYCVFAKKRFLFIEEKEQKKKIRSKSIRRIVRHCQNRRRAKPLVVKNGTRDKIIRSVINGRITLRSTHQEFITIHFESNFANNHLKSFFVFIFLLIRFH